MTTDVKRSLNPRRQNDPESHSRLGPNCVLPLLSDPRLGGVLPGLRAVAGGFEFAEGAFQCCAGTGLRADPSGARRSCELRARMRRLSVLASRYEQSQCRVEGGGCPWPGPALEPAPRFLRAALERLAAIVQGQSHKGLMYQLPAKGAARYSLWTVALMATWRFGFDVRILDLRDAQALQVLTSGSNTSAAVDAPPVLVLVDQAGQLWDQQHADRFELAVGLAYRSRLPLWIAWQALTETPASAQGGTTPTKHVGQALAARLARIKARAPMSWVDAATRRKLVDICEAAGRSKSDQAQTRA